MRILLLSQSYPPRLGGVETVAQALAVQLSARGHEVRVLTNRFPRRLPARERREGVEVRRALFLTPQARYLRRGRLDLWLAGLVHGPLTALRLRRLMRRFRPDVVNVHFPDVMIPFVLRLRQAHRFRLVVSLHGHEVLRFTGPGARPDDARALREVLRQADAVTACSRHLLDEAARLEPAAARAGVTIHNGIDPERFAEQAAHAHPRPYVLALGRATHKKGFDLLLDALARVGTEGLRPDLILAGEGEELPALKEQARRLGLADRVSFFGRATQGQVVRLLNGCRLLVVPSRVEPFGIVALEGLAAGKPVLATRVGGLAEFLGQLLASGPPEGQPVVLAEPDAGSLAAGLRACLQTPWPGDQRAGAAFVRREYSWARVARRYEAILCGPPGPADGRGG
jgi:glycosyltransferase involved in cell wall biosynthesis